MAVEEVEPQAVTSEASNAPSEGSESTATNTTTAFATIAHVEMTSQQAHQLRELRQKNGQLTMSLTEISTEYLSVRIKLQTDIALLESKLEEEKLKTA